MQLFELILSAVAAAVVLFSLYTLMGRRMGRQPEDAAPVRADSAANPPSTRPGAAKDAKLEKSAAAPTGLAALKAKDSGFDPAKFLDGARTAYRLIVQAYVSGDREELKPLTTATVYQAFDAAMSKREAESRTEQVEFLQGPRADLDDVSLSGDVARVRVRFLAELRTRTKDATGEAVDDRRTAELWTFERPVASRDPNWALARVEAAEA